MTRTNNRNCWLILLASLSAIAGLADAFGTSVVYGPVSKELVLLTSKLAAKEGEESFCIVGPGSENRSRKFLYGIKEADELEKSKEEDSDKIFATPISSGDDMQNALSKASTLFLMCYENPIEEKCVVKPLEITLFPLVNTLYKPKNVLG